MLDLFIIEVTFTTMSPRIIPSAARLKACSFNLVIPKIRSSSILIFSAALAHLNIVVHLAYHQFLPLCLQRMVSGIQRRGFCFVDKYYPYSVNLVLAQILNEADRPGLVARLSWSHSHSQEKEQYFETRLRIIFLALAWRDEIEIII